MEFDLIIRNGRILDGSGAEAFRADVGISGKTIAAIGDLSVCAAGETIDAAGKTVTPGFLDMHRHADAAVFRPGFGELELKQGLTTVGNGNCGLSVTPVFGEHAAATEAYLRPITGAFGKMPVEGIGAYHAALRAHRTPIHTAMLTGMGTVRAAVAGFAKTELSDEDYRGIHRLLERELSDGAFGVSLGLGYAPECFYDTAGLVRALEPIRNTDTVLSVHMRGDAMHLIDAIEEVLHVAGELRVPLQIGHLKAIGRKNWNSLIFTALERIRKARGDGIDVMCDVYPYTAGSTQLLQVLPPEFLKGGTAAIAERLSDPAAQRLLAERIRTGTDFDNYVMLIGWDNIFISSVRLEEDRQFIGKSVAEAAGAEDPSLFAARLLSREECAVSMIDYLTSESDIAAILKDPNAYVISDATYPTEGIPHPRVYGTFVRVIERFANELHALSLPEAVRKMTRMPADRYGLRKKGRIEAGADADLLIFDPARVHEHATYADPTRVCEGIETVLVNGTVAVKNGVLTGRTGGTVLERR